MGPPFPSGPSEETQHHVELINYFRLAVRHHLSEPRRFLQGGHTKSHFNELSRQDLSHNKNISIQTVSYHYHSIKQEGAERTDQETYFSISVSEHESRANSIRPMMVDVIKLKDVAGFVDSVCTT